MNMPLTAGIATSDQAILEHSSEVVSEIFCQSCMPFVSRNQAGSADQLLGAVVKRASKLVTLS